jgi:hypothetical protein
VSVACTTSGCKGRHIQKLHDFLKDVFREENRVHVVHGDNGWEESDEAWELGEEEMMIVGTVQQEDDCSWQDACKAWMDQDEEAAVGVHQVRADQEASEQAVVGQCKEANTAENGEKPLEVEDLLVEGEEQEYFLELLMRRASPEQPKGSLPAGSEANLTRDRKSRNKMKKAGRKNLTRRTTDEVTREEGAVDPASGKERQVASNLAHNPRPRAGDWLRRTSRRRARQQSYQRPQEGSVPDRRSRNIPEVVLVRCWAVGVLGIWRGGKRGTSKGRQKQGECAVYSCTL